MIHRYSISFEEFFRKYYILAATLFLGIIVYGWFFHGHKLYKIGFLLSFTALYIIYFLFLNRKIVYKDNVDLILKVAYFNIIVLFLYYISSFEVGVAKFFWRVSFDFGNFMDFITLPDTYASGTYTWISTGHFPFTYALSKIFAEISNYKIPVSSHTSIRNLYLIIFFLAITPLIFLIRRYCSENQIVGSNKFLVYVGLLASYPLIMGFERGNFAFISATFLTLAIIAYDKGYFRVVVLLLSFAISLKTVNLVFLIFIISRFGFRGFIISMTYILFITISSLIFIFGVDFDRWATFYPAILAPINSPVVFSDANKIIATTGLDGLRVALLAILNGVTHDLTSDNKLFNRAVLFLGMGIMLTYYLRKRENSPWYVELLLLVTTPLLFHSASGDYNLQLLMPILLIVLLKNEYKKFVPFLLIPLLLVGGIPIDRIFCCGDGTGRAITLSIKSLLIPFSLSMIIVAILTSDREKI